jgi:uncharacterized protein with FMN-binding domain
MKRKVLLAIGTTVGVGGSLLITHTFFGSTTPSVAPTPSSPSPISSSPKGTYLGTAVDVSYGIVQVQITVSNGKITDAKAVQSPSGRSERFSSYAIPVLREQTLAAQSANIQGATGASYTSFGWKTSLQAAMKAANL